MKGYAVSRRTTVDRVWHQLGFGRKYVETTSRTDWLECEVGLGLPTRRPQDRTVMVCANDHRGPRSLDVSGPQAAALGDLLFEAGCRAAMGAPAFEDLRGSVALDDEQLCIRFREGEAEGLPPIQLIATDHAAFPTVDLYPQEAVGIGLGLIFLAHEIAQAGRQNARAA